MLYRELVVPRSKHLAVLVTGSVMIGPGKRPRMLKHLTVLVTGGVMIGPGKRPRMLKPSKISELIFDTDSDKVRALGDVISGEGGCESVPGVSQPQLYC